MRPNLDNYSCYNATAPVNVSNRYSFVSTKQFIDDVERSGFELTQFKQPRQGYGLHIMQFSHPAMPKLDGVSVQLYATNSHNGTKPFTLGIAMLRLVCTNGLVATRKEEQARIVHVGYAPYKVAAATEQTMLKATEAVRVVGAMQTANVSAANLAGFAYAASKLRRDVKPLLATEFLAVRRDADRGTDLWTIFNRVQESLIRGGYITQRTDDAFPGRVFAGPKARAITSIGEQLSINQQLWSLAQDYLNK